MGYFFNLSMPVEAIKVILLKQKHFWKICEGEMFITIKRKNLLQIYVEFMLYYRVIFKTFIDAGGNFSKYS